ncbi:hypothetical protein LXL04_020592 [Taraxacum kok-saghyz]
MKSNLLKTWRKQRQQSEFAEKESANMGLGLGFEVGKGYERVKKGNKRQAVSSWDMTGGKEKIEENGGVELERRRVESLGIPNTDLVERKS